MLSITAFTYCIVQEILSQRHNSCTVEKSGLENFILLLYNIIDYAKHLFFDIAFICGPNSRFRGGVFLEFLPVLNHRLLKQSPYIYIYFIKRRKTLFFFSFPGFTLTSFPTSPFTFVDLISRTPDRPATRGVRFAEYLSRRLV